jgi:hypothetical protein
MHGHHLAQAQLQDGLNGVDDGDRIDPSMLNAVSADLCLEAAAHCMVLAGL